MSDLGVPLCVDFDGTLTPVNTAHERLLAFVKSTPRNLFQLPGWALKGRTNFWRQIAAHGVIDVASLPLRDELIEWLREQRGSGRWLVLLVDGDPAAAEGLAAHLDLFDQVTATNAIGKSAPQRKLDALASHFGEVGFDFVGSKVEDEPIWNSSRRAIVVGDRALCERVGRTAAPTQLFAVRKPSVRTWIRAIRLHQWVKNGLIFLPALLAHSILVPSTVVSTLLAFLAFGLCASSVYVLNDLFDLTADRHHARKRHRPFAAGLLSARSGLIASALLLLASAMIAAAVNVGFAAVLAGYYVLTWAYSVRLKRVALLDVMILAALYTVRIIAGAAATDVPLSFWLLAFSVFLFLSLGFVKRYAELESVRRAEKSGGGGRGYSTDDLPLIMSLGAASGYCSIVVMALYINSSDSQALYHHHKPLWLICPLMLFWISRVWTLTSRGHMHDDPVVFALRDRVSLCIVGLLGLCVVLSI